jgi:chondroitin 4-sulfotransferase 11
MMRIPEEWINMRCQPADNIVLREWKAVYISIPKVACTSIRTALAELLGHRVERNVHFEVKFPKVAKTNIRRDFPDYFVFAFVRNPWDRLLSCFLSKIDPGGEDGGTYRKGVEFSFWKYGDTFHASMSFTDFVNAIAAIQDEYADIHFGSQYRHVTDSSGKPFVDFIGRFESLSDDLAKIAVQLGMPRVELPHLVRTEHGHYSEYYTPKTRELVRQRYDKDLKLFSYRFEKDS